MRKTTKSGENGRIASAGAPVAAVAARPVPIRDEFAGRLSARLDRLDPRVARGAPVRVRCELVSGADGLGQILPWWRALAGAASPANPALDPDAAMAALEYDALPRPPGFVCLWREADPRGRSGERELIGLMPFSRVHFGRVPLPVWAGWAPSWSTLAAPLIHRRHQAAAATGLAGWLAGEGRRFGALVVRDLAADGEFVRHLIRAGGIRSANHGRPRAGLAVLDERPAGGEEAADVVVRSGRELPVSALESELALIALWADDVGPDGMLGGRVVGVARHAYLVAAAAQGRVAVAEALGNGHTVAIALAVRTGATASIVDVAANPRLGADEQAAESARALAGLVGALRHDRKAVVIQAGPGAPATVGALLNERVALRDVVIAAPGVIGRLARMAAWLVSWRRASARAGQRRVTWPIWTDHGEPDSVPTSAGGVCSGSASTSTQ